MRLIKSENAFKPSYIAEVKEELGLLKKRKKERKVKAPEHIKEIIKEAIKRLGYSGTYKDIQIKSLEVYNEWLAQGKLKKLQKFRGSFKIDKELVIKIAQDEEIFYAD